MVEWLDEPSDPTIGRFVQPDSIIPSYANPQTLNRFAYVVNSPILLNDPTGHKEACGVYAQDCKDDQAPLPPVDDGNDDQGNGDPGNPLLEGWEYFSTCAEDPAACYMQGWYNFGSAWSIYWNPDATASQRFAAWLYGVAWLDAHATFAVGSAILLEEGVAAVGAAAYNACLWSAACASIVARVMGITVYRAWGGESGGPGGKSWTPIDPRTVTDFAGKAGLPPGNTGQYLSVGTVTDLTDILIRPAAPIGANPGGLLEYFLRGPAAHVTITEVICLASPLC